jgi:hypothetical protein
MFHVRQKAPETPNAFALDPSAAIISWGEMAFIVAKPMLGNRPVVKVNCMTDWVVFVLGYKAATPVLWQEF